MRVLLIEDNEDDASLTIMKLEEEGFELDWERVASADALTAGLSRHPDAIIADYNVPGLDIRDAIRTSLAAQPDMPVIVVSGSMSAETGLELMRLGAQDYLIKGGLERLGAALRRSLDRAGERRRMRAAESEYRSLFEQLPVGVARNSPSGETIAVNSALLRILRFPDLATYQAQATALGTEFISAADRALLTAMLAQQGIVTGAEVLARRFDGTRGWIRLDLSATRDSEGTILSVDSVVTDIDDRKRAEAALQEAHVTLGETLEDLRKSDAIRTRLYEVSVAASGAVDVALLGRLIVEHARELVGGGVAVLRSYEPTRDVLHLIASVDELETAQSVDLPPGESILGEALQRRQAVLVNDYQHHPLAMQWALAEGVSALVAVPLLVGNEPVGALGVAAYDDRQFSDEDATVLSLLAAATAPAIQAARLHEELALSEAELRLDRDLLIQSRKRLAHVVDIAPVILFEIDLEGIVRLAAGRSLELFGVTSEEAIGREATDVFAAVPDVLGHLRRGLSGETFVGEVYVPTLNASLALTYGPVRNEAGELMAISGSATDVSERVRGAQAREESDAKTRLVAHVNHEIRTPLNSILGFTELLKAERSGPLNEKQARYLGNVESAGRHLLALVTDSLDMSKITAGKMDLECVEIELAPTLNQAAEQVEPIASTRGLAITVEVGPNLRVRVDRRRLLQILWNLLSNAIRHSSKGGLITIVGARSGDRIDVSVSDTGVGIPADQIDRIFDEYTQVPGQREGTGLGLPVSRRLAQLMDGDLRVTSEFGVGSTFTVSFRSAKLPASKDGERSGAG